LGGASYAGIAEPKRPPATRCMAGSEDGRADQSKVISASSSLDKPSPQRADFQLSNTDRFLDLDTDRPARRTRNLKADQEGRVMLEDVRSDQADSTWDQKGLTSKTFRGGSLGAGTASSTLGAVMKQSDHTKWWSEWLVRIGIGGVALQPSHGQ